MPTDIAALKVVFFEEADELLASMEVGLLALEQAPSDTELLNQVFRVAHSIKGGSGIFGFIDIQSLAHVMEGLLDKLRSGDQSFTPEISALVLRAKDMLAALFAQARHGTTSEALADLEDVKRCLAQARVGGAPVAFPPEEEASPEPQQPLRERPVQIVFAPKLHLLRTGMNPLLVLRDVAAIGRVKDVRCDTSVVPLLEELDPEACYLEWTIVLQTARSLDEIRDVFAFVEDLSRIVIAEADEQEPAAAPVHQEPTAAPIEGPAAQASPVASPPVLVEGPAATPQAHGPAEPPAACVRPAVVSSAGEARQSRQQSSIRVDTDKIDRLVDMVGELVIAQSMVSAALDDRSADGLRRLHEAVAFVARSTRELQERVMAVRMVPVRAMFERFRRLAHDTSVALGKEVDLVLEGVDTEIDKGVVEKLVDPLTHLVRNAVDHGIETPDRRSERGKPSRGTVTLRALHQGGSVVVEVVDDGQGLPLDRILEKARARGLVAPDEQPSAAALHALVFEPGFSTAEKVTDVSGRGVGMDVVKRNVEALSGKVDLTSEPDRGSRVRIRLPLTLAIQDGLAVRLGEQTFVLPLVSVLESFRPTREQVHTAFASGRVVHRRGEVLPLVPLHQVLGVADANNDPTRALVCIVEAGADRVALLVDDVLGQAQFVVKSLEKNFARVEGVMGATILGDGRVSFILDVPAIIRKPAPASPRESFHAASPHAA